MKSRVCAVTGSFDPITTGHVNIVERAKKLFDKVYVLMLINPEKTYLFSEKERLDMLNIVFSQDDRVEVAFYSGYTADFCKAHGIDVLVRGIRNEEDLNYEKELAKLNYDYGKIETCFLVADESLQEVSSTVVREELRKGKILLTIPEKVRKFVEERFNG